MNRVEFERECRNIDKHFNSAAVSEDMYQMIEYVYTWYPSISEIKGKEQIALLYTTFGFAIIQDMYARACECAKVEAELDEVRHAMSCLANKKKQLTSGLCERVGCEEWQYADK